MAARWQRRRQEWGEKKNKAVNNLKITYYKLMPEVKAQTKYLRISPRKMLSLCKLIRGKHIVIAKAVLMRSPKKGAKLILKTLDSAIANAKNKNISEKSLFIKEITANQGPSLKRWIPWSRGIARPIKKRTTHLTIVLGEEEKKKEEKIDKK